MLKWEKDKTMIIPKALKDAKMPDNLRAMEKIGSIAAGMLFKRITTQGVDGFGVKLPPLADTGWFFTAAYDGRFGGKLKKIRGNPTKGTKTIQIYGDGYKKLKRAMGSTGKRGTSLTGAMWDNLKPALKQRKGWGWDIVLQFGGSQQVGKANTGKTKTLKRPKKVKRQTWANQHGAGFEMVTMTEVPVLKMESIKNRTKARFIQKVDGRWAFTLLSFNQAEMEKLMEIWLRLIKKKNPELLGR